MKKIALDTETTGLSPDDGDRIVEIGCVEIVDRQVGNNMFHEYFNPERDMPEEAEKVHGLSTEFLSDKPKFAEKAASFLEYIRGAELIIHNADFDVGFLNAELARLDLPRIEDVAGSVTDSLAMARELFPGRRNNLDVLCERFGIDNSDRTLHGALLDAQLLALVYLAMTRGQETLAIEKLTLDAEDANRTRRKLSSFKLRVLKPTEEELKKHEAVLDDIEKGNKGKTCVWREEPKSDGTDAPGENTATN